MRTRCRFAVAVSRHAYFSVRSRRRFRLEHYLYTATLTLTIEPGVRLKFCM